MANPNWKKGGESPNKQGRPRMKHSARTVKGMVERFVKKNLNAKQLQRMYQELDSKDQFKVLTELLPYCAPKQSSLTADINFDALNDKDLDALYLKVTEGVRLQIAPTQSTWFDEAEIVPESQLKAITSGQETKD